MSPSTTSTLRAAPPDPVVEWRRRRLLGAGVRAEMADWLARGAGVDLHRVLELIDRGCPPDLAARIFAPLDGSEPEPPR